MLTYLTVKQHQRFLLLFCEKNEKNEKTKFLKKRVDAYNYYQKGGNENKANCD